MHHHYRVEGLTHEEPGGRSLVWLPYHELGSRLNVFAWRVVYRGREVAIYDNETVASDVANNLNNPEVT